MFVVKDTVFIALCTCQTIRSRSECEVSYTVSTLPLISLHFPAFNSELNRDRKWSSHYHGAMSSCILEGWLYLVYFLITAVWNFTRFYTFQFQIKIISRIRPKEPIAMTSFYTVHYKKKLCELLTSLRDSFVSSYTYMHNCPSSNWPSLVSTGHACIVASACLL